MNVKKQVIENVRAKLVAEQNKLKYKCNQNAYTMKKLTEENTIAKREISALGELIKSLN